MVAAMIDGYSRTDGKGLRLLANEPPQPQQTARTTPRIFYGYWLVGGAFIAQFATVGARNYVGGILLKPMSEDLDWSRTEFTLARTLGLFIFAFAGLYIGSHVDRHGGRRLMFTGATVLSLSLMLVSQIDSLWQWMLLNGVIVTAGAAMAGGLVVNVTLAKWFVERRGRAVAFASMGVSFAGVAIPPLTTAGVDAWGWRGTWIAIGIVVAAILFPVAALMRRSPEDHGLHPDGHSDEQIAAGAGVAAAEDYATSLTRAQALRTPSFYLIVLAFGFGGLSIGVMLLQTIPFMTDAGYSSATASYMIVLTSIPSMLSKPVWGYLLDRASPSRMATFGFVVNAISLIAIVIAVRAEASDAIVFGSFILLGFGWGGLIPLQEVIWATYFGRRYLGAVRSAGLPFALVLQAGGPLAASIYFDVVGDYNGAFLAVAALSIAAAILVQFLRKPQRAPTESVAATEG